MMKTFPPFFFSFHIIYVSNHCHGQVWEIDENKHEPDAVLHTLGWPLDHKTYGGSFLYHMKDRQVSTSFFQIHIVRKSIPKAQNLLGLGRPWVYKAYEPIVK